MKSFTVLLLVAFVAGAYVSFKYTYIKSNFNSIFFYITNQSALTKDQTAKSVELAQACIKEGGVDPEVAKKLRAGDFSDNSVKAQCFALCFLQKAGLVDAAGIVQEKVAIEKLSVGGDKDKVISAVNKCKDVKGATPCETAHKHYKCYYETNGGVL